MILFDFKAKDQAGLYQKGKVEARDLSAAAQTLRDRQLVIITLKPANQESSLPIFDNFFSKIKSDDIVTLTQQLSTMIDAGLPLADGLSILQVQSRPAMARVIGELSRDIQGGSSFGNALEATDGIFSKIYISAVRAGEASGKLDEVLDKLALSEEKKMEFERKTKGALVYPVIVITTMMLVMVIMMVAVVPKLISMFNDFGTDLPATTKLLIAMSGFMQKTWWLMGLSLAGIIYGLRKWYQTKVGRAYIDQFVLKIPIYGILKIQIALSDITRTLALLVGSGISILEALEIVTKSADNVVFEHALVEANQGVEKGLPLATMLARQEIFPPLLSQMVSVGEETGKLSDILLKVAHYYESQSENAVRNLTTAIEPLIMIVLGISVAFLVFAIIMPIYKLTSSF